MEIITPVLSIFQNKLLKYPYLICCKVKLNLHENNYTCIEHIPKKITKISLLDML
jgi:hypothetical protein